MGTATTCVELCLIGLAAYSFIYPWVTKPTANAQDDTTVAINEIPLWGILLGCALWVLMAIGSGDVGLVNFRIWAIFAWIIVFVINLAYARRRQQQKPVST